MTAHLGDVREASVLVDDEDGVATLAIGGSDGSAIVRVPEHMALPIVDTVEQVQRVYDDEVNRGDGVETDGGIDVPDVVDVTAHVSTDGKLFCWFGRLDDDAATAVQMREDVDVERIEAAIMTELPDEWLDRAEARLTREGRREDPAPRVAELKLGGGEHDVEVALALDGDAVDAMTATSRDRERGRLMTDGGTRVAKSTIRDRDLLEALDEAEEEHGSMAEAVRHAIATTYVAEAEPEPGSDNALSAKARQGHRKLIEWTGVGGRIELDTAESILANHLNVQKDAVRKVVIYPLKQAEAIRIHQGIHSVSIVVGTLDGDLPEDASEAATSSGEAVADGGKTRERLDELAAAGTGVSDVNE